MIDERVELRSIEGSRDVQQRVLAACEERGFDASACFAIRLALEEAISNAMKHGNQGDPAKSVVVRYRIDGEVAEFEVEDEGTGFEPGDVPDPTLDENLEVPSGRGIVLMRSFMTEVDYIGTGNVVRMRYDRSAAAASADDD